MNFLEELERVARAVESAGAEPRKQHFNPRPAGFIRPGKSSEAVLSVLRQHGGALTEAQLRFRTGLNHAKCSWALLYLQKLKKLAAQELPAHRNSRYRRYKAKIGGSGE